MNRWTWACLFFVIACGGRTEPLLPEGGVGGTRVDTGAGQGGAAATTAGGTSAGGAANSGGTAQAGTTQGISRRWFLARGYGLYLVGARSDHVVEVHDLSPNDGGRVLDSPIYSASGHRICYRSATGSRGRLWAVELDAFGYRSKELFLPEGPDAWIEPDCYRWLSDTLLIARFRDPAQVQSSHQYRVLSIDPATPVPRGAIDLGEPSPDGKMSILPRDCGALTGPCGFVIRRVTSQGLLGPTLLTERTAASYYWSEDSRRIAFNTLIGSSLTSVYDLSEDTGPRAIDLPGDSGDYVNELAFSPDGRYLYRWLYVSGFRQYRVDDLDRGTHAELIAGSGLGYLHEVTWASADRIIVYLDDASAPGFYTTRLTEESVASGKVTLYPLRDADGPLTSIAAPVLVADSRVVVNRSNAKKILIQVGDLTDSGLVTKDLIVESSTSSAPCTMAQAWHSGRFVRTFATEQGSSILHYIHFRGAEPQRVLRLADALGTEYIPLTWNSDVDGVGFVAMRKSSSEFAWLYLDGDLPGPLVPVPPFYDVEPVTFFQPPRWAE